MVITLLESDTSDLRELCRIAGGDPLTFYRGVNLNELDLSKVDREFFQQGAAVADAIIQINGAARQEERIAILMDQILQNRNVGTSALLQYSRKRAKFEKRAAELIRQKFDPKHEYSPNDQLIAASLVQRLFADVFPYNSGILLYFLARHLGKYPKVNSAIRECMTRTSSMNVEKVRHDVERILSDFQSRNDHDDDDLFTAIAH